MQTKAADGVQLDQPETAGPGPGRLPRTAGPIEAAASITEPEITTAEVDQVVDASRSPPSRVRSP